MKFLYKKKNMLINKNIAKRILIKNLNIKIVKI